MKGCGCHISSILGIHENYCTDPHTYKISEYRADQEQLTKEYPHPYEESCTKMEKHPFCTFPVKGCWQSVAYGMVFNYYCKKHKKTLKALFDGAKAE